MRDTKLMSIVVIRARPLLSVANCMSQGSAEE